MCIVIPEYGSKSKSVDDIIKCIVGHNSLSTESSEIKIIFQSIIIKQKFSVILEVNVNVYSSLVNKVKLCIGWNRCKI